MMDGSRRLCMFVPKPLGVGLKYGPKQFQVGDGQFILLKPGIPSNYKTTHEFYDFSVELTGLKFFSCMEFIN